MTLGDGQGSPSEEGRTRSSPQWAAAMVFPGWACLPGQMGIGDVRGKTGFLVGLDPWVASAGVPF